MTPLALKYRPLTPLRSPQAAPSNLPTIDVEHAPRDRDGQIKLSPQTAADTAAQIIAAAARRRGEAPVAADIDLNSLTPLAASIILAAKKRRREIE